MTLRNLKWIFLGTLVVFFVILQYAQYLLAPFVQTWYGRGMMSGVVLLCVVFLFGWIFNYIQSMQERLERQHRELVTLHRAALDIYGNLTLDTVLQKVVDQACQLLRARYGAIAVYDEKDRIQQFLTSGLAEEAARSIGDPPQGKGLLGVLLSRGEALRLPDLRKDSRSGGFPPNHPAMTALLGVPIVFKGPFRGNLYVADRIGRSEFDPDDEQTLVRFAAEAAIAVDNAHLHQRIQSLAIAEERVRIAREMHDGMAQVLAYVNTKAQAVKEFLLRGKEEDASAQLEQLARAAREVYLDVREGILALRTQVDRDRGFAQAVEEFVDHWERQSGIEAEVKVGAEPNLSPMVELQLLRIIQEALSNVRKHAEAENATVFLLQSDGTLRVAIHDDGRGFEPGSRDKTDFPRFGLAIMKERAESIDAHLTIESDPGGGTRIEVQVPIP